MSEKKPHRRKNEVHLVQFETFPSDQEGPAPADAAAGQAREQGQSPSHPALCWLQALLQKLAKPVAWLKALRFRAKDRVPPLPDPEKSPAIHTEKGLTPYLKGAFLLGALPPLIASQVFKCFTAEDSALIGCTLLSSPLISQEHKESLAKEFCRVSRIEPGNESLAVFEQFARQRPAKMAAILREHYIKREPFEPASIFWAGSYSRECLAAVVLSYRVHTSLFVERVLRLLTAPEREALGRGMGEMKKLESSERSQLLASLDGKYLGDWLKEHQLASFISSVLREGLEINLGYQWQHRLAAMLMTLPPLLYDQVYGRLCGIMQPDRLTELLVELHAQHSNRKQMPTEYFAQDFLSFYRGSVDRTLLAAGRESAAALVNKLYRNGPEEFLGAMVTFARTGGEPVALFLNLCGKKPEMTCEALLRWSMEKAEHGAADMKRAPAWILSLLDESSQKELRAGLTRRKIAIPDDAKGMTGTGEMLTDFVHHFRKRNITRYQALFHHRN